MVATVGICSSALCSFDSMAGRLAPTTQRAFTAAISAGLKPRSSLWVANYSTVHSPSTRRGGRSEEDRLVRPGWAPLSRFGAAAAAGTYYPEGRGSQGERLNSTSEQVYGQPLERAPLPRPPTVDWEKDLANAVQLIGRVGRDINMKYLDDGRVVAHTSLAVSRAANRKEDTTWFDLEMWDDLAEVAAHHVAKGEQIFVTGRIVVDKWMKDEVQYTSIKVVVRDICYVEPYSDPREAYSQSNEDSAAMGSGARAQEEAPNTGSSQRNWNQQQLANQPSRGTAMQRGSSNNEAALATEKRWQSNNEAALATEKRWQEYFADPTQWWDNRHNKRNPKSPDFKHKSTQEALWIKSWSNPTWVEQQLAVLDEKKAQLTGEFGDSDGRSQKKTLSSFKESDFLY